MYFSRFFYSSDKKSPSAANMQRLYYSHRLLSLALFFPLSITCGWAPSCREGPSPFSQAQQHLLPDYLAPWDNARGPEKLCMGYASEDATYPLIFVDHLEVTISAECDCDNEGNLRCLVGQPGFDNVGGWSDAMMEIVEEYCLRVCRCDIYYETDEDEQSKVARTRERKRKHTNKENLKSPARRTRARGQRPAGAVVRGVGLRAYTSQQKHCTPVQMAEECRNMDCGMGDLSSVNLNQFRKGECLTLGRLSNWLI